MLGQNFTNSSWYGKIIVVPCMVSGCGLDVDDAADIDAMDVNAVNIY
jgi:hypothetical protein